MTKLSNGPDIACPTYNNFADLYGGKILREIGDLQIVDGDLAMTRDQDLMLGDKSFDAMRRLLDEWRFKTPHLTHLFNLSALMVQREVEAKERLCKAENAVPENCNSAFKMSRSPEFQNAWQAHFDEEAAAQSGRDVYPGCIILMASYALSRFRDDIGCNSECWNNSGPIFSEYSVGQIVVASANGVRHQDDWFKTHSPTKQQYNSIQVLRNTLDAQGVHNTLAYSAGRCEEVIELLAQGGGFDGFTTSMFSFAHNIAETCRKTV